MNVTITKYLVREIFKSQLVIMFILFLIFFCQRFARILGSAVDGNIPTNLILPLLSLGISEMAQLILPLSLFLGLLMTLSRMYTESEIIVMYACGLGKSAIIHASLLLSLMTIILSIMNVVWFSPWSSCHQDLLMSEIRNNHSVAALIEGQFKTTKNGNFVLFVGKIKNKNFEHVFLAQPKPNNNTRPFVMIADRGHIKKQSDGSQLIILEKGIRYEGTAQLLDFYITDFNQYQAILNHQTATIDSNSAEKMSIYKLWFSSEFGMRSELHWRFTVVVSVLILAMIAVPLSIVNPRQGRALNILPAMLLYLVFFLIQTSLRSNGAKGKLDPMLWMWLTNITYLVLALMLNLWDSVPIRKFRWRLYIKRAT